MKATSGGTVCGRSTSLTKVSGATSRTNSFAFGKSWGNDVLKSPGLSRVVEIQTTTSPERKAPKSEPVGCAAQRLPANSITSQHKPNPDDNLAGAQGAEIGTGWLRRTAT